MEIRWRKGKPVKSQVREEGGKEFLGESEGQ